MELRELSVPGAYEVVPVLHGDDRGLFHEWFRASAFEAAVGRRLDLQQANCSVSQRGVLRGIHYADVPPSQAKYVFCLSGSVLDVVVDIRVGSPTFGQWDSVLLGGDDRRGIFISEGLGHAFYSLEDDATVAYICSTSWSPGREHEVDPLDPAIGIDWPTDREPILSAKDRDAPSLAEAAERGLLPAYADCLALYADLAL